MAAGDTNFTDLVVSEGPGSRNTQEIDEDGAINITSGVVVIGANLCITGIVITLPDPVTVVDDFKRLKIIDQAGAAHTVTPATPFGNGGVNEAQATFSGVVGDGLALIAYGGFWYVTGKHQVTIAAV